MRLVTSDLWNGRTWRVVTTNLSVRKDGLAVMGRGIVQQAAQRYARLPREYGKRLQRGATGLEVFREFDVICLPVKHDWREPADLALIETSLCQLADFAREHPADTVLMPLPGVGSGGLSPDEVWPLLRRHLAGIPNVVVVRRAAEPQRTEAPPEATPSTVASTTP